MIRRSSLLLMFAFATVSFAGGMKQTFTGIVTDSMCGQNHAAMKIAPDAKCVRECVKHGSQYVLFDGHNLYKLSDQATPEQFAGKKVRISGELYEKTGIIRVDAITPAQQ